MNLNEALQWIAWHGLALLVVVAILLVVYRIGLTAIKRLLPQVMAVPPAALGSAETSEAELAKRAATIPISPWDAPQPVVLERDR
jgi:hypothetical protein